MLIHNFDKLEIRITFRNGYKSYLRTEPKTLLKVSLDQENMYIILGLVIRINVTLLSIVAKSV